MTATARSSVRTATGTRPQRATRPKLKVLNQEAIRQRARRRNALLFVFIVVLVGFFGVAFVHAQLVAGQQDLDSIRSRIAEAEAHRAKVARLVEEASAPEVIVSKAEQLGMVRAHQPVYLQAVAPVRELPVAAAFVPQGAPEHLDVAAGVSSPALGISAGVSGSTDVVFDAGTDTDTETDTDTATDFAADTETPQPQPQVVAIGTAAPAPVAAPIQTPALVQTPAGTVSSTGGAFGGVSVATSGQSAPAAASPALVGVSTANAQPQSSFAGSSAVSGGQGTG